MPVDEAKLTQYALGMLDDVESRTVRQEIAGSLTLQKELATIRNALQHIALAEEPVRPSASLRNRVLEATQDVTRFAGFLERFADLFDLDRTTSQDLLAKIDPISNHAWESTVFPGVKIMKFCGGPRVASATCGIVQVKAGKLFPAHRHQGDETTLVLQGKAQDDSAKTLLAGDIFHLPPGSSHSFHVLGDEPFVYAVVLHKDNKWLLVKTLIDYLHIKKHSDRE